MGKGTACVVYFGSLTRGVEQTVKDLALLAARVPEQVEDCLYFVAELCRECGLQKVIDILRDFGTDTPRARPVCEDFAAQLAYASA